MKMDKLQRKACIVFSLISILFSFFCITGRKLAESGNIIWDKAWTGKCVSLSLVCGILMGVILGLLLFKKREVKAEKNEPKAEKFPLPSAGKCFFLSWGLLLLAWLPVYLAYFPGIGAYDFIVQLEQIDLGVYNEHHPLIHTLMVEFFYDMGCMWNNPTLGIAIYSFCQLLVFSGSFAVAVFACKYLNIKKHWIIILQVYAMFMPFNGYMAVSITKDVYFTAFMMIQTISLAVILAEDNRQLKMRFWDMILFFSSVGMILFRNNGRYALAVAIVFVFAAVIFGKLRRKLYLRILLNFAASFIVGSVLLAALMNVTGAQQGDRREMLSMPIQQLARTMVYHGGVGVLGEDDNAMAEADKLLINEFILEEAYKDYRPEISDPVKKYTNTYVFVYRMKDFMKTYLGLFSQYPGDFVNAALAVNAGYLYPGDETHAYVNVNNRDTGLGYIQTRWLTDEILKMGIRQESKWPWLFEKLEQFADANAYLKIPVLKWILVPGVYLWLCLFISAWFWLRGQKKELIVFAIFLGYFITLLLGPTVQLRYIYPIMVILPFVTACFGNTKLKEESEQ
ncbi:MAG: hypothetical protein IJ282_10630 [Lachnospiraceae bacterium]|nr:hypothetical protein [Lachnospiraceae bacterium]